MIDPCCEHHTRRFVMVGGTAGLGALMASPRAFAAQSTSVSPIDNAAAWPTAKLRAFDLADVTLDGGPFLHAQRKTEAYLLALQPDRMLHNFRVNAGLKPKAPVYGGWESELTWAEINCHGHTLGHYLSACALAYRSTGDERFKERTEYIARDLAECQKAANSGLVCAFPDGPALVTAHLRGEKITGVPWYTLHKVYAGLRDAAALTDSPTARAVLISLADWAVEATRPLTDAQFETMLETEHGGMSEVFADLYAMTGELEYRRIAQRFAQKAILAPLVRGRDNLDGLHANTQLPKIVASSASGKSPARLNTETPRCSSGRPWR